MGITFRDGSYTRFVRCGRRTIKHGEAAAIWNSNGEHRQIIGPTRVILFNSTIRFLTHFKAKTNQYLRVTHRDGNIDHIPGPISMYLDPTFHDDICVQHGIELKENDVIFVSSLLQSSSADNGQQTSSSSKKKKDKTSDSSRAKNISDRSMILKTGLSIVDGPTIFIPGPDDVVENLEWNILPDIIFKGKDIPKQTFQVLALNTYLTWKVQIPIGPPSNIKAHITVLIKYKIEDVEKVARHKDPHSVLIAGLLADAQELNETAIKEEDIKAATKSATEGGETSSSSRSSQQKLNSVLSQKKSYKNLVQTGESCGFRVGGVKLLGIQPGEKLLRELDRQRKIQTDAAIKVARKRDSIKFQQLELQEQEVKLKNSIELSRKEAQMKADLAVEQHNLRLQSIERELELEQKRQDHKLEMKLRDDESNLEYLRSLKGMGVDLTTYLSSTTNSAAAAAAGVGGSVADRITSNILRKDRIIAPTLSGTGKLAYLEQEKMNS